MLLLKAILFSLVISFISNSMACEVRVSWEAWSPYQVKQKTGNPTGLDIELLDAVLADIGCSPIFVELPWTRQLIENEIGNIDIVMGASKSSERAKYADFSIGYRNEISALFMSKGKGGDIKKLSDLFETKLKIGAVKGNLYSPEVDAKITKFDSSANNDEINIKKCLANRIDGFLADRYTGTSLLKQVNATEKIVQHPLPISTSEVYFMVSKKTKNQDLVNKLSKSIKKLSANKLLAKIISKYE